MFGPTSRPHTTVRLRVLVLDPYRERIAYLPVLAALPALHHLGLNLVWRGRVATTPDDVAALAASPPSAPSPSPCKTLTTCGRCSLPPPFCPGRSRRCRVWSIRGSRWGGRAAPTRTSNEKSQVLWPIIPGEVALKTRLCGSISQVEDLHSPEKRTSSSCGIPACLGSSGIAGA